MQKLSDQLAASHHRQAHARCAPAWGLMVQPWEPLSQRGETCGTSTINTSCRARQSIRCTATLLDRSIVRTALSAPNTMQASPFLSKFNVCNLTTSLASNNLEQNS